MIPFSLSFRILVHPFFVIDAGRNECGNWFLRHFQLVYRAEIAPLYTRSKYKEYELLSFIGSMFSLNDKF